MNDYPKTVYKNVLLLDGKIVNWKTGTTHWKSIRRAFENRQTLDIIKIYNDESNRFTVVSTYKIVNSPEENNEWFADKSFYRQFEIHESYPSSMWRPYE